MKIEDVKVGMRVIRTQSGGVGTVAEVIEKTESYIYVQYPGKPREEWHPANFQVYAEAPPATLRNTHMAVTPHDDTAHRQMLAFFATPLTPNTCRKCAAPTPCKYHE